MFSQGVFAFGLPGLRMKNTPGCPGCFLLGVDDEGLFAGREFAGRVKDLVDGWGFLK